MNFEKRQIFYLLNFFILGAGATVLIIFMYRLKVELARVAFLKNLTEKYEILFQTTSEGVLRCSKKGDLLTVNPAGAKTLGFSSPENMLQKAPNTSIFFSEKDLTAIRKLLKTDGKAVNLQVRLKHIKKENRYIDLSAHIRSEEDSDVLEGIFHDISEKVAITKELTCYKNNLENLVKKRTDQLEKADQKIRQHENELQQLSTSLVESLESERKRISRDLHDEIGQALTAIQINHSIIAKIATSDQIEMFKERLEENKVLIGDITKKVHETALDLRPSILDELGLIPALQWYIERFTHRTGIAASFDHKEVSIRFEAPIKILIYRVLQEALQNIAKHAQAQTVAVSLLTTPDRITCRISDDGTGFNQRINQADDSTLSHIGLISIRERIEGHKGQLTINSELEKGTSLTITLPLEGE